MAKIFRTVSLTDARRLNGDLFEPSKYDLIAVVGTLDVEKPVPEGFRVFDGNTRHSIVSGVFRRGELEAETKWL